MNLASRLARNLTTKARPKSTKKYAPTPKPKVDVPAPAHAVVLKASSAITHPPLEAALSRYGQLSELVLAPSKKAAVALYTEQEALDRLNAETNANGVFVGDAMINVNSSLALEDVTVSQRSDMLRLSRVPWVATGGTMHEALEVLKPFGVNSVHMLIGRNVAWARFDTREGTDEALKATWSREGVWVRGKRVFGNYHPSGTPQGSKWRKVLVEPES